MIPRVVRHVDAAELADAVAIEVATYLREAIALRGRCTLVLAGGRTPRGVYERLARAADIDWRSVIMLFGDERAVPPDDPASNFQMACDALIGRVTPRPTAHRIAGELGAERAAAEYAEVLATLGPEPFDVVLLGMGDDGHVASIFPGEKGALEAADAVSDAATVIATTSPLARASRVSLTLPVLANARAVLMLVTGAGKAARLAEVWRQLRARSARKGPRSDRAELPAARIADYVTGPHALRWHVDVAAASTLEQGIDMNDIGVIGLGVMGRNLAWNIADHGFKVAVWNREPELLEAVLKERSEGLDPAATIAELVEKLEPPRMILVMITAGKAVDIVLDALAEHLEPGDIVIDGGNSWFEDTRRREAWCSERGLSFVGMGVSGGEQGARFGPSLMPGGKPEAWTRLRPVLEAIAARTDSGPCVTHVGPDGAGHFVKMVHNGIEYADMQLIAEAYDVLRRIGGLDAPALAEVFAKWNRGPLESFLIDITATIFSVKDPRTGGWLVDKVLDQAGSKGTGKWTVQVALDLGVAVPSIAAALDARVLSSMKPERVAAAALIRAPEPAPAVLEGLVDDVHDALFGAKVLAYAQGMALVRAASEKFGWAIAPHELARIWKGGCIIRARFLDTMMQAYAREPGLQNLSLDAEIVKLVAATEPAWRRLIGVAVSRGIPVPAMSASLAWYDSYRTAELPQNLTQAQRDAFGAHTYQRSDAPAEGFVHTDWLG